MLFLANFDFLLSVHFVTHPRTPQKYVTQLGTLPPIFSRPSTKSQAKALCTNSLSIVCGTFCPGFCQAVFCVEGFVRSDFCPLPLLSEYICDNRKLNIILNFMFHKYDKNIYKCDVTGS